MGVSVQTLPASATEAATPKAQGIPAAWATNPSRIGPPPSPRSMKALAVPEAAPRSEGFGGREDRREEGRGAERHAEPHQRRADDHPRRRGPQRP